MLLFYAAHLPLANTTEWPGGGAASPRVPTSARLVLVPKGSTLDSRFRPSDRTIAGQLPQASPPAVPMLDHPRRRTHRRHYLQFSPQLPQLPQLPLSRSGAMGLGVEVRSHLPQLGPE